MAKYKDAIEWIVENDDTDWLEFADGTPEGQESVTAALVADIFFKEPQVVRKDLLEALKKYQISVTRFNAQKLSD